MTTRIDFYILPNVDLEARTRFTCRLAYRAVAAGHGVHVHTDCEADSKELDALMWEYPDHQFLPHCLAGAPDATLTPVTIGSDKPAEPGDRVLINLAGSIPDFFGGFDRVAEIVVENQRDRLRERYRYYRNRGYALYHHAMDQWEDQ